jgi:hypothetical protein
MFRVVKLRRIPVILVIKIEAMEIPKESDAMEIHGAAEVQPLG